eukprot:SAG31_NODE_11327_length_1042_cov_0.848356_1_plen_198_part_10
MELLRDHILSRLSVHYQCLVARRVCRKWLLAIHLNLSGDWSDEGEELEMLRDTLASLTNVLHGTPQGDQHTAKEEATARPGLSMFGATNLGSSDSSKESTNPQHALSLLDSRDHGRELAVSLPHSSRQTYTCTRFEMLDESTTVALVVERLQTSIVLTTDQLGVAMVTKLGGSRRVISKSIGMVKFCKRWVCAGGPSI